MKASQRCLVSGVLMLTLGGAGWLLLGQTGRSQVKAPLHALDAEKIAAAAGSEATTTKDGVVRLSWPRKDVAVTVDGMPLKPFAGLASWAALTPAPHGAMLMGDTVVFQDEVTPAIDAAFAGGLEVTALHNHFFFDEPKVFFMHIGGHGDPEKLAAAVKGVWDAIKQARSAHGTPVTSFPGEPVKEGQIDASSIEKIVGHKSETQGGVVKLTIGRDAAMQDVKFSGSMGLATWAAFSGSDDNAAIDGDFAMTADEVEAVLHALRRGKLNIVALHNHMVGETPAIYFTHFWAKGPTGELAHAFRATLDAQANASALAKKH